MSLTGTTHPRESQVRRVRGILVGLTAATSVAGAAGALQLIAGVATPPAEDLPLGLTSWVLPGLWLAASVAVPCGVAARLGTRDSPRAPLAATLAAAGLATELAVQVPFVGLNVLQAVFAADALAILGLARTLGRERNGTRVDVAATGHG